MHVQRPSDALSYAAEGALSRTKVSCVASRTGRLAEASPIRYLALSKGKKMALFGSVSGKEVDRFAKSLAEEISKRYPPALDTAAERTLSDKRVTTILENVCNKAAAFKNEHKLGVYKKARLGNTFRWELEELGYSKKFIETATEGLVVYLTRKT